MTRISTLIGVVGAIALGIAAPAFADSQLAASAGLTDEEAAGMTLTEIAQYKFNRDSLGVRSLGALDSRRRTDRPTPPTLRRARASTAPQSTG